MEYWRFRDRAEAGRCLAGELTAHAGATTVVLGLPRGGVVVAGEVAAGLGAALEVVVARKLGVPGHRELAMGAVAEGGVRVLDERLVGALSVPVAEVDATAVREYREIDRQVARYREGRRLGLLEGRTAVVVDDGMATGMTAEAALGAVRRLGPARIVLAVPVCPGATAGRLRRLVDEFVCPLVLEGFTAVGHCYDDFSQTPDDEVLDRLARARRPPG